MLLHILGNWSSDEAVNVYVYALLLLNHDGGSCLGCFDASPA